MRVQVVRSVVEPQVRIVGNTLHFLSLAICAALTATVALGYDNEAGKETIYVTPTTETEGVFKVNATKGGKNVNIGALKAQFNITDLSLASNQAVEKDGEFLIRVNLAKGKRGGKRST